MNSYIIDGPAGGRFERVRLRLCAYTPLHYDEQEKLKVVLQVIDHTDLIAEDPIVIDYLTPENLTNFLDCSTLEGWVISPDPTELSLAQHREKTKAYNLQRYHLEKQEKNRGSHRSHSGPPS